MSRIGKRAIPVPKDVTVTVDGQAVKAKGPKGELEFVVNDLCLVALEDNEVTVKPVDDTQKARAMWGMSRTRIANIIAGAVIAFLVRPIVLARRQKRQESAA